MTRILFSVLVITIVTLVIALNYRFSFYNRAAIPPPPPKVNIEDVKNNGVESPDGTMRVILQTKNRADNSLFYSIFTETSEGKNRQLLYATNSAQGKLTLSPNSWSPDNAYIFILQKVNDAVNGLVFKVNNKSAAIDRPIIVSRENIVNITGWESPTFLHIRTMVEGKIAAYWFDVASKSFMAVSGS